MGLLHLLTTGLLTHLPLKAGDTAGSATATDETDRRVTDLDLVGDIEDLDLGIELSDLGEGGVSLVDHDITGVGHVGLIELLDVHTDVVTGHSFGMLLVVHLDGEDLTEARVGGGMGGEELNFLTGLDD